VRHKHRWKILKYRASPLTTGASGRGRTVAWRRVCLECRQVQQRHTDYARRRTVWCWEPEAETIEIDGEDIPNG